MSKPADSSLDRIRRHLVGLKMPCTRESLQHTVQRIERGELSTFEAIEALLGEELTTLSTGIQFFPVVGIENSPPSVGQLTLFCSSARTNPALSLSLSR
jgi:hypothetical protein